MASQPIYQFYAELKDYKPLIWRRFQVAGNITLAQLGYVTMTLFEMKGSHLFHLEYSVNENMPDDDPAKGVEVTWKSHANLFYANWLNFVYQETPYDLADLEKLEW